MQKILTIFSVILISIILFSLYIYKNKEIVTTNKSVEAATTSLVSSTTNSNEFTSSTSSQTTSEKTFEVPLVCESDCNLFPVDKKYSLTSTYVPELVQIPFSRSNRLTKESAEALNEMYLDAKAKGISIKVVSAYRSYDTQKAIFNNWVNSEIKEGLSKEEAIISANTYSAKEGHSEHQLGTTVDLGCLKCKSFEKSKENQKVYDYIEKNAHRFGFTISYYKNSEELTQYIYEPWHVRYIGKELAEEFYNTNYQSENGEFLSNFLFGKWLLR